jgi:6-phosphogluconolactonase
MTDGDTYLAFVGTYTDADTDGIYSLRIDAGTGDVERIDAVPGGQDPSFLALHPDGEHLYAVNEADDGRVTAFAVDRGSGELTRLNSVACGDAGPCHCSVDATGSYVLAAHYAGGSVSMLPIEDDGRVGEPTSVVDHEGSSVDPDRQTAPHPHSITPGPENRFAYVPDLGTDEVVVYELDREAGALHPSDVGAVQVHPGAGPRHVDFHPNGRWAYLINELDSTMTVFAYDADTGGLEEIEHVSTLPAAFDGESYTADVHVHPSGEWLYGSNRGHDSIAHFGIDPTDGRLDLVGRPSTRGEWPRNFALDPPGAHLFAENRESDDVVVFDVDEDTGGLAATGHVAEIPEPACMVFLRPE